MLWYARLSLPLSSVGHTMVIDGFISLRAARVGPPDMGLPEVFGISATHYKLFWSPPSIIMSASCVWRIAGTEDKSCKNGKKCVPWRIFPASLLPDRVKSG